MARFFKVPCNNKRLSAALRTDSALPDPLLGVPPGKEKLGREVNGRVDRGLKQELQIYSSDYEPKCLFHQKVCHCKQTNLVSPPLAIADE